MNSAVNTVHFKKQLSGERFIANQNLKMYNKRIIYKILYRQTCNNVIYIGTKCTLMANKRLSLYPTKKGRNAPREFIIIKNFRQFYEIGL